MKKLLIGLAVLGLSVTTSVNAQVGGTTIANPQLGYIGARLDSLGGPNPAVAGDINGLFINPAVIGTGEVMPFTLSTRTVLNSFNYQMAAFSFPMEFSFRFNDTDYDQRLVFGLGYAGVGLDEIPETVFLNNRIWQVSSFGAGFDMVHGSVATEIFDVLGFHSISTGVGLKMFRQYIKDDFRSAYGIDVGAVGIYNVDYLFFQRATVGISALNLFSTSLRWEQVDQEAFLPLNMQIGASVDMFNEQFTLYASNSYEGLSLAGEYTFQESFQIRGGTDFKRFYGGTGIILENIAGFLDQTYSMRIDYTLSTNSAPFDNDTSHTMSVTIVGDSRPQVPRILEPKEDIVTQKRTHTLRGVGPKNTAIRIYNNDNLARTTFTNRYGNWKYDNFPLKEGKNDIYVKSYSIEQDLSQESDNVMILSDTHPPQLEVKIFPLRNQIRYVIVGNEPLYNVQGAVGEMQLEFEQERDNIWLAIAEMPADIRNGSPFPSSMKTLRIRAEDEAKNINEGGSVPFFVSVDFPGDKIVHSKERLRLIGQASPMVTRLFLNEYPIYIDQRGNYSISSRLNNGKNLLKLRAQTLNNQSLTYLARVLYLKQFDDVVQGTPFKNEIEFMATLGAFEGDENNNFVPNETVTRRFLTKVMVNASDLEPAKDLDGIFFPDVSTEDPDAGYIQTAIQNGLIFANPDGTFEPDAELTFDEIAFFLSNAGIIGEESIEDGDRTITRGELAQFLSITPRYELLIEDMINWDTGYR
jgi:hypothetical protein